MLPRNRLCSSRHKVKCQEFHRELDSDHASKHFRTMHKEILKEARTPAVMRVVPESQPKISRFFNTCNVVLGRESSSPEAEEIGALLPANVSTSTAHDKVVTDSPDWKSAELQLLIGEEREDAATMEMAEKCVHVGECKEGEGEYDGETNGMRKFGSVLGNKVRRRNK